MGGGERRFHRPCIDKKLVAGFIAAGGLILVFPRVGGRDRIRCQIKGREEREGE